MDKITSLIAGIFCLGGAIYFGVFGFVINVFGFGGAFQILLTLLLGGLSLFLLLNSFRD